MALQIEKVLSNRFEFSLDGGTVISTIYPRLFTDGTKCHFKTSTGANIIKKQNVDVTEVTVIECDSIIQRIYDYNGKLEDIVLSRWVCKCNLCCCCYCSGSSCSCSSYSGYNYSTRC